MIAVIDYEMGNLRSIYNAFVALGCQVKITRCPEELAAADIIVLPGVGAFADGMNKLRRLNMIEALNEQVIQRKKLFLGICLGMQFLATQGLEHGIIKGLNWIPGIVEQLTPVEKKYKIPHIGWNDVHAREENGLFKQLGQDPVFYFVHSYHFNPDKESEKYVTSTCWHGGEIVSSVQRENIFGVQFHPEKSQGAGLQLIQNMLSLIKKN